MSPDQKQVEKFRELAKQLQADESEENFDRALKKIAKAPPDKDGKPDKGKPAK